MVSILPGDWRTPGLAPGDAPQIPSNEGAPPGSPVVLAGAALPGSASRSRRDLVVKERSALRPRFVRSLAQEVV